MTTQSSSDPSNSSGIGATLEERIARRLALRSGNDANAWVYMERPVELSIYGWTSGLIIDPKKVRRLWTCYIPSVKAMLEEMTGQVTL